MLDIKRAESSQSLSNTRRNKNRSPNLGDYVAIIKGNFKGVKGYVLKMKTILTPVLDCETNTMVDVITGNTEIDILVDQLNIITVSHDHVKKI